MLAGWHKSDRWPPARESENTKRLYGIQAFGETLGKAIPTLVAAFRLAHGLANWHIYREILPLESPRRPEFTDSIFKPVCVHLGKDTAYNLGS